MAFSHFNEDKVVLLVILSTLLFCQ